MGLSVDRATEECAAVRPMAAGTASASAARAARRRGVLMRRHFLPLLREADVDRRSAGGCRARAPIGVPVFPPNAASQARFAPQSPHVGAAVIRGSGER